MSTQKYPHLDLVNAAAHATWIELLEARGYQWAPLIEAHSNYAGPEVDFQCELVETNSQDTKSLVLTFGAGGAEDCFLLGYEEGSDIPTIFSPNAASVEIALRWVGAL